MGLFLALSGVIGASSSEVQEALKHFAKANGGGFEVAEGATPEEFKFGIITREGSNTSVLLPDGFTEWDEVSQFLSKELSKPVFSFHIHDGDFWMYILFNNGEEADHFNPVPHYWEEISEEEERKWKGDAEVITKLIPSISAKAIEHYLRDWKAVKAAETRAYPDDVFAIGDCWQITDFMRKMGLTYPMGEKGERFGSAFYLWTELNPLEPIKPLGPPANQMKKSFWKLW